MRSFRFRLQRVLEWRASRYDAERLKLDGLIVEQRAVSNQIEQLRKDLSSPLPSRLTGVDLQAHAVHSAHLQRQLADLNGCQQDLARRIALQQECVLDAKRNCELIERLRDRAKADWVYAEDRENEALSAESYLATWTRDNNL